MTASSFLHARCWRPIGFASVSLLAACSAGNGAPLLTAMTVPAETPVVGEATDFAHLSTCRSNVDCRADRGSGLCMPKPTSPELSDAEDFLEQAMSLDKLVTRLGDSSRSSRMQTILQDLHDDAAEYSRLAQGGVAPGASTPPTNDEMQHAAWLQSGATQAEQFVQQITHGLSTPPVTTDAQKVYADVTVDGTGRHLDAIVGDLQTLLQHIEVVIGPSKKLIAVRMDDGSEPGLTTGAGATRRYLGPLLENLDGAMSHVRASLDPSTLSRLEADLALLSQRLDLVGHDGYAGTCLESL